MLPVTGPSRRYPRRYRDGCPAPECDRNWCRCRPKSWSYARAAAGKRPGIPGRGPPPVPGARANGRPRSRHLPGRSSVGRPAPFTAAPGSGRPTRWPMRPRGRTGDVQDDDQYGDVRGPKTGGPYRAAEDYGGLPGVYGGVRYGDGDDGAYRAAGPAGTLVPMRAVTPTATANVATATPAGTAAPTAAGGPAAATTAAGVRRFPLGRLSVSRVAVYRHGYFRCEPFRGAPARKEAGQMPRNVHVT